MVTPLQPATLAGNQRATMRMYLSHTLPKGILELPRFQKRAIAVCLDVLLCIFTVALAYRLRLDAWIYPIGNQWLSYLLAVSLAIPIFIKFGLYRAIFRYVGWYALSTVTLACMLYGAIYSLIFSVVGMPLVPRTTGLLQPILLFVSIGASRALARFWLGGGYAAILGNSSRRRVLIYGAGSAGRQLAGGLANSNEMQVVAFVDDDTTLHGNHINGKSIFPPDKLDDAIEKLAINDVLLAFPSVSRKRIGDIVDSLRRHEVTVRTLPGIFELADGKVTVSDLRPVQIEDLLGRDPVPPEPTLMMKCVSGKSVLVTGAGGSIGSEICRQIVAHKPTQLILVDHSEYNLYAIDQELNGIKGPDDAIEIVPVLASVTDHFRMERLFRQFRPTTVYHAAAYKHVHLVESNPTEGIRNNIFGTRIVANLAREHNVSDFVLISTDKAVRPPNIMGATKRVAEMLLQVLAKDSQSTRFSMVRFGNVLGSSGSVVPLFRKQIAKGGPVTVTHAEVTRYFMTIPEAAQLVIQAGAMAEGGDVFVLDMGEPVKIVDLAHRMIELSGLSVKSDVNPGGDIEICVIGLRQGEKLYEELLIGNDPMPTAHPRIMKAQDQPCSEEQLRLFLSQLENIPPFADRSTVASVLKQLVPEIERPIGL